VIIKLEQQLEEKKKKLEELELEASKTKNTLEHRQYIESFATDVQQLR
jgi:hypothetical protein